MQYSIKYYDADGKETIHTIEGIIKNTPSLIVLDNDILQSKKGHDCRTFQTSNWFVMKDGKIQRGLFHERYYTPYNFFKEPTTEYWICDIEFPSPEEAIKGILDKGCDPNKFWAQQHFYTELDGNGCFLMTNDFNEALKFLGYQYKEIDKQ